MMIPPKIEGKVYVVGPDIDTDAIIPAPYLTTMNPDILRKHAMESLDTEKYPIPFLNEEGFTDYAIIIAGSNFGCGSSREHAPIALSAAGVKAVIAPTFARIFYRNSINGGRELLPLESLEDLSEHVKTGDLLTININERAIYNKTKDETYEFKDFGPVIEILEAGGLTAYNQKRLGLVLE